MKRFFYIFIFLLLAACAPVTGTTQQSDPNIQLAIAGAQLTGTAQAWQMQQVSWTVTAQSWTVTPSLTPVPTSTPTITFTPTVNVTGTMAVEYMQREIRDIEREQKRKDATNAALAWLPYIIFGLAIGLAVWFGYVGLKRLSVITVQRDEKGDAPLVLNVVKERVTDSDKNPNYESGTPEAKEILWNLFQQYMERRGYEPVSPRNNTARQDLVTARDQHLDLARRRASLPKELVQNQSVKQLTDGNTQLAAGNDAGGLFPLPSWEIARGWDGKGGLPFGVHAGGMGLVDLEKTPHTAVFGETGSGKSRRFLRPLITFALAAGMRVVILGKQVDFLPFANHQNAYILPVRELTLESEAMKYAIFLKAMVDEMGKRDQYLSSVGRSTWAQAGREMTLFVFDEYTNAMDLMPRQYAETTRRYTRGILREGRKYGFSMMLSAQRAVGLRDEVTQLGRAVFHVSDPQESRFALGMPGAEDLQEGYFMAKFGALNMTGAFEPTDAEIASFLADRRAPALEPLPWLDGKFIEPMPEMAALPEKSDLEKLADSIRAEWRPDMSKRAVARLIGKDYAGAWASKIDAMIAYLMSNQNKPSSVAS